MAEDVESEAWTIAITNRIADASSDTVLTTNQGVMTSGVSKDRRASAAATPKVKSNGSGETAAARKARKQAEAEARKRKQPLQAQADKLERKIGQLGEQLNDVESKLAAPEIYDDASKSDLQALLQQQASLRGTIDACEAQWMDVLEELDAM